jgi:hypothetical protein
MADANMQLITNTVWFTANQYDEGILDPWWACCVQMLACTQAMFVCLVVAAQQGTCTCIIASCGISA